MPILSSLKTLIASLLRNLSARSEYQRMEDYLSDACDIHELEARQRSWDQRALSPNRQPHQR